MPSTFRKQFTTDIWKFLKIKLVWNEDICATWTWKQQKHRGTQTERMKLNNVKQTVLQIS